jgi:hypothetical protein
MEVETEWGLGIAPLVCSINAILGNDRPLPNAHAGAQHP